MTAATTNNIYVSLCSESYHPAYDIVLNNPLGERYDCQIWSAPFGIRMIKILDILGLALPPINVTEY